MANEVNAEGTKAWVCLGMSLLAGLSTTLGALFVFLLPGHRVTDTQMAFSLSLAGGVMLSVTILEFWLPILTGGKAIVPVVLCSSLGIASFLILSCLVPEPDMAEGSEHCHSEKAVNDDEEKQMIGVPQLPESNPEKLSDPETIELDIEKRRRSLRLAFVMMLSLTAHNFPEGFAVAISASENKQMGIVVMLAIGIHNIPEGIAIAVPVLVATGSKSRALWMSFLSGMAEPVGAFCALVALRGFGGPLSENAMENLLCVVGGVMCAVALKELLPEAMRRGDHSTVLSGTVLGFVLMWLTIKLGA